MGRHSKPLSSAPTLTRIVRIALVAGLIGVGVTLLDRPAGVLPQTVSASVADNFVLPTSIPSGVSTEVAVLDTGQKDGEPSRVEASRPTTVTPTTAVLAPSTVKSPPLPLPPPPAPAAVVKKVIPPAPAPVATPPVGNHAGLVTIARSFIGLGIPYVFGGKDPATGLDCSGFVWTVLKKGGYNVPYRTSLALSQWATPISAAQARPGDLVFFYNPVGHVGIYAGPGIIIDDGTSAGPKQSVIWGSPSYGRIPL